MVQTEASEGSATEDAPWTTNHHTSQPRLRPALAERLAREPRREHVEGRYVPGVGIDNVTGQLRRPEVQRVRGARVAVDLSREDAPACSECTLA